MINILQPCDQLIASDLSGPHRVDAADSVCIPALTVTTQERSFLPPKVDHWYLRGDNNSFSKTKL